MLPGSFHAPPGGSCCLVLVSGLSGHSQTFRPNAASAAVAPPAVPTHRVLVPCLALRSWPWWGFGEEAGTWPGFRPPAPVGSGGSTLLCLRLGREAGACPCWTDGSRSPGHPSSPAGLLRKDMTAGAAGQPAGAPGVLPGCVAVGLSGAGAGDLLRPRACPPVHSALSATKEVRALPTHVHLERQSRWVSLPAPRSTPLKLVLHTCRLMAWGHQGGLEVPHPPRVPHPRGTHHGQRHSGAGTGPVEGGSAHGGQEAGWALPPSGATGSLSPRGAVWLPTGGRPQS